jgi:hypothetical protein
MDEMVLLQHLERFRTEIRSDLGDHEQRDEERFGVLGARVDTMTAKVGELFMQRAEQVGAARAIAELAERRATKNTRIVSIIAAICAVLTLCIQKHWLGL